MKHKLNDLKCRVEVKWVHITIYFFLKKKTDYKQEINNEYNVTQPI